MLLIYIRNSSCLKTIMTICILLSLVLVIVKVFNSEILILVVLDMDRIRCHT